VKGGPSPTTILYILLATAFFAVFFFLWWSGLYIHILELLGIFSEQATV